MATVSTRADGDYGRRCQAGVLHVSLEWNNGTPTQTEVVPAVAGKQVLVLGVIVGGSAVSVASSVKWKSGTTAISGTINHYDFGYPTAFGRAKGILITEVGEALQADLDGNGGGLVIYTYV